MSKLFDIELMIFLGNMSQVFSCFQFWWPCRQLIELQMVYESDAVLADGGGGGGGWRPVRDTAGVHYTSSDGSATPSLSGVTTRSARAWTHVTRAPTD